MKKFLSMLITVCILLSMVNTIVVQAAVLVDPNEKKYVVVAEDDSISGLIEEYDGIVLDENTFCASLNSYEAAVIYTNDDIVCMEEDIIFYASETEDDSEPVVANQWYLDVINARNIETSEKVKIEILDSGVDFSEDYSVIQSINLVEDGNESAIFADSTGHGSAIASVLGGYKNNIGIDGINPSAELYSVKVLDSANKSPLSRIVEGIYWGIENGMDIINMSFGTDIDSEILHKAISDAYNAGILIVAAAGNTEHENVQYPAAYDEVISVGSVNATGNLSEITSVDGNLDILAPGENILTSTFLDTVSTVSGTSVATAQVTGVASLLCSRYPNKSNRFIKELLCSAVNKPETLKGVEAGIVNYAAAIEAYDELNSVYEESVPVEIDLSVSEAFDYYNEGAITVEGLWKNSSNGHAGLTETATINAGFVGNAPAIVRYACTNLDRVNREEKNKDDNLEHHYAGAPHGSGNYVINLRFLYLASRCIYDNGVGTEYEALVDRYINNTSYWDVDWRREDPEKDYDKSRFIAMVNQVDYFLETKELLIDEANYCGTENDYLIKSNFDSYSTTTQNRYLGLMIFGMALHLAGDMYAHRSIVPSYTIVGVNYEENTQIAEGRYRFGGKYFNILNSNEVVSNETQEKIKDLCYDDVVSEDGSDNYLLYWEYFQKGVALQVVEFRDINMFLLDEYKGVNNPFEDNTNFSSERYSASMLSCTRLAKRFKEAGTFYTKLIYPKDFEDATKNEQYQYIKLNNFENYTKVSGLDYIGVNLSESDWDVNSNANLV